MRVLMTGATGYLGSAMRDSAPADVELIATGFTRGGLRLDITDPVAVRNAVHQQRPDVVVHLAAVSLTASAGEDPDLATRVNVTGARAVAAAAGRYGVRLVALSSDVVFDGTGAPYREDARPNPINAYGASKLAGEEATAAEHPDALILRTSVLVGRNRADRYPFSMHVLQEAREGREITLYENERRNFYPVTHAASAVWECAGSDLTGVLHIAATESSSRFEFGRSLLLAAGLDADLATPAIGPPDRPSDLTLSVERAAALLDTPMPTPEEAIDELRRDLHLT
ncbi:MAG: NAD(P)-dependent oxidoreductase [Acidimicrobiia bacterium]|nr:NAD(P)-dependent oxidoreductase [Acidimicrobiia bacterium]NNF88767.1 NAD(P)-dependent oxidoreductase [Acidimicrobiia bacterium]NNL13229.1 NAD(P)-dependent oxidoreductase [Acidimicrobiia bacterium]NNL97500.1 NAD(P)-dependent oxidoreductase [Acidimicrobiia bacterium]RZV41469.1 MAG: NAD(P)-dependent oxidoreductase [Acidimicrobiia bacterium]